MVPDLLDRALGVLDVREADRDLVGARSLDLRLGDAERVGALADRLDRVVDVLRASPCGTWGVGRPS